MANENLNTAPQYNGARYIFLENAISRKNAAHLIGAVVPKFYETHPYDFCRPNWKDPELAPTSNGGENESLKQLEQTMDKIWMDAEQPVTLQDVLMRRRLAISNDVHAKFTTLLEGVVHKDLNEEIEIESGEVKFYSFDNPGPNVSDLLFRCKPWKRQVEKLIHENKQQGAYYIVTGVAVVKDTKVSWVEDENKLKSAEAKLPGELLNAATQGMPVVQGNLARVFDIGAKWQKERAIGTKVFAKCSEEIIFAVKYDELDIELEPEPDVETEMGQDDIDHSNKKPNLVQRMVSSLLGRPKKPATSNDAHDPAMDMNNGTNGHVGPPTKSAKRPRQKELRKLDSASLGLPVRGYGFSSAFGSESSVASSGSDSDRESDDGQISPSHGGGFLLVAEPPADAFYTKKTEYIRAGDGARMTR